MAPTIPIPRYDFRQMMGEGGINEFSDLINQPPACRVKRNTAGPSIPTGTGYTNISWESDVYDPFNMWVSGNPTAITIGYTAHYDILFQLKFPQTTAGIVFRARIVKMPGPVVIAENSNYSSNVSLGAVLQVMCPQYPLAASDYLIFQVQHDDSVARSPQVTDSGTFASVKYYSSGVLGT